MNPMRELLIMNSQMAILTSVTVLLKSLENDLTRGANKRVASPEVALGLKTLKDVIESNTALAEKLRDEMRNEINRLTII